MPIIFNENHGFLNKKTRINESGIVEVIHTQDVEPIIEQNKRDQADRDFLNGFTENGDMKHVARVPLIIWQTWWQEECTKRGRNIPMFGKEMNEVIRRRLNDPENKFLRTGQGQIGERIYHD